MTKRSFIHNKSGTLYLLVHHAIDCTNERDGIAVIVYHPDDDDSAIYVREKEEFFNKFTEAK